MNSPYINYKHKKKNSEAETEAKAKAFSLLRCLSHDFSMCFSHDFTNDINKWIYIFLFILIPK